MNHDQSPSTETIIARGDPFFGEGLWPNSPQVEDIAVREHCGQLDVAKRGIAVRPEMSDMGIGSRGKT